MKRLYGIAVAFALAGCATTQEPAIEVRTVEVLKPVPVACVDPESVPSEPGKVGDRLNGNAAHDADLLAGSAIDLRQWGRELMALIRPCTTS